MPNDNNARSRSNNRTTEQHQQGRGNNQPQSNQSNQLTTINAPYNFVPLANRVVTPDWAAQVSHDLPFKDGLSGEIVFTLTAHSPLLVGGVQQKAARLQPGEVRPFQTPDGSYAIPGSSLRGMIRAVLEIATFSKMELVDDKRYGLRDITGPHVKEAYAERVRGNVQTGFLRLSAKGEPEIVPCAMARLSHRDLESWWKEPEPIFNKSKKTVQDKYKRWEELCKKRVPDQLAVLCQIKGEHVTAIGKGDTIGFPVFTGQISDSSDDQANKNGKQARGKYKDFVFYSQRDAEAFAIHKVDPAAWRDFLFIHGDEDGKSDMSWPGHWKERFWQKKQVPVFYLRSSGRLQIGLAYMPKLAGDFSIHDMIKHTTPAHLDPQQHDFATLMFGKIDDRPNEALKGRVWFELAVAEGNPQLQPQPIAILNSPKPTYFPNYLNQPESTQQWKLNKSNAQYATYLYNQNNPTPELRGRKRYPARPDAEIEVQEPRGEDQQRNAQIQIRLHTLAAPTKFNCRIQFHNLKPEELGALLWCLDFGGKSTCRHSLGLGKSFGFGQVTLEVIESKSKLIPNDPAAASLQPTFVDYQQKFCTFMQSKLGTALEQTPQIKAILTMADVDKRPTFPGQLKHMILARETDQRTNKKTTTNEFQGAKQSGLVLAPYISLSFKPPVVTTVSNNHRPVTVKEPTVSNKENEIWQDKLLKYAANTGTITADNSTNRASSDRSYTDVFLAKLNEATITRLKKGKLKANVTVKHRGGSNWIIVQIELCNP